MKLGLLTDVHEHVEYLRAALAVLQREDVEQIVLLGDLFDTGARIAETCSLLAAVGAVGVWGNHDFGLCRNAGEELRNHYGPDVLDFMGTLQPRWTFGECYFSHVEPWLDPENVADLWYFEGPPDCAAKCGRIFASGTHRLYFGGHYHRWLSVTPDGIGAWQGETSLQLEPATRYFTVVGPLCNGHFATFDTDTHELRPLQVT